MGGRNPTNGLFLKTFQKSPAKSIRILTTNQKNLFKKELFKGGVPASPHISHFADFWMSAGWPKYNWPSSKETTLQEEASKTSKSERMTCDNPSCSIAPKCRLSDENWMTAIQQIVFESTIWKRKMNVMNLRFTNWQSNQSCVQYESKKPNPLANFHKKNRVSEWLLNGRFPWHILEEQLRKKSKKETSPIDV